MYIKIYFGDKPLFLCDTIDSTIEPFLHHDDAVFIDELNTHTVKAMIHEMQVEKVHAGVFYHPDLAELQKAFFKKFTIVKAGGGLILNEDDEALLIFRRGKWDLPKGKLDDGETIEACAVREVEEETGIKNVQLVSPLMITYHTYHEGARFILKESHWYNMRVHGKQSLVPQAEEDINEVKWVAAENIAPYLLLSYPSVADVLKAWSDK
jgi:8-oxo-dGTP pyrophosphatase MutT (NUDIX family)